MIPNVTTCYDKLIDAFPLYASDSFIYLASIIQAYAIDNCILNIYNNSLIINFT